MSAILLVLDIAEGLLNKFFKWAEVRQEKQAEAISRESRGQ